MRRHEVPVAATGLLRTFAEAGMFSPADFHVARRMGALAGNEDPAVELAIALAVRELRLGSTCLDVATAHELAPLSDLEDGASDEDTMLPWPPADEWLAAIAASPATDGSTPDAGTRPCVLVGARLYLARFWQEEEAVAARLAARSDLPPAPVGSEVAPSADGVLPDPDQDAAVTAATTLRTVVLTGGPGTGKTTTVARILNALMGSDGTLRVALAAPTGKAAATLEDSVRRQLADPGRVSIEAGTLHRLLGAAPGRSDRTHDAHNPLTHDIVVVDETSMVSLTQMGWLLEAVPETSRLLLIGDPQQLVSVEAGAVLADITRDDSLIHAPGAATVRLRTNRRSNPRINELATAIQNGDAPAALDVLAAGGDCQLIAFDGTQDLSSFATLTQDLVDAAAAVLASADVGAGMAANQALHRHRVLCAHREGPFGVGRWGEGARSILAQAIPGYAASTTYVGQPLLMTRNSDLAMNGDTGVVVRRGDRLVAAIAKADGVVEIDPGLLSDVADLHAMTIHKSQGGQFTTVSVVVPPLGSPLLTRELLYTAVTRAREGVRLYGSPEAVAAAVATPARRASGLGRRQG